jgi:hypothetical protein
VSCKHVGSPWTGTFPPCLCDTIVHKYLCMSVCVYIHIKTVVFMWCAFVCVCIYIGMAYHKSFLLQNLCLSLSYILCMYACMYIYMYIFMYMFIYICIYIYILIYIYVYKYIYILCVCGCIICVYMQIPIRIAVGGARASQGHPPRPRQFKRACAAHLHDGMHLWSPNVSTGTLCVCACVRECDFVFFLSLCLMSVPVHCACSP